MPKKGRPSAEGAKEILAIEDLAGSRKAASPLRRFAHSPIRPFAVSLTRRFAKARQQMQFSRNNATFHLS